MAKAGFGQRFLAYMVDQIILQAVGWLVLAPVLGFLGILSAGGGLLEGMATFASSAFVPVTVLLQFIYFGFFWSNDGQSPGKRVMGIKVVSQGGGGLSFMQAGLRGSFGYWLSGLVFSLGYVWAAFDADGEAWHDKLYHTRVVIA